MEVEVKLMSKRPNNILKVFQEHPSMTEKDLQVDLIDSGVVVHNSTLQ